MAQGQGPDDRTGRVASQTLLAAQDRLGDMLLAAVDGSEIAWTTRLRDAARALEEALLDHRDLGEAPNGSLEELTEQKPALADEADAQRAAHAELLARSESLAVACDRAIAFDEANVEILRLDGQILYLMLRRHLAWESVLSYEAFFRQEGGEGGT